MCERGFSYYFSIKASASYSQVTQGVEGRDTYWDALHLTNHACLNMSLETNFPPSFPFREISGTAGASGWFWMLWRVARVQPLPAAEEEQPWGPGTCREGAVQSSCTPAAPQRVIRWCCGGTDMSIRLAMSHIHSATQPGLWNATSGTANTDTFPSHLQEPRLWAMSPLLLQKNASQAQTKTNKWGKLWKH